MSYFEMFLEEVKKQLQPKYLDTVKFNHDYFMSCFCAGLDASQSVLHYDEFLKMKYPEYFKNENLL